MTENEFLKHHMAQYLKIMKILENEMQFNQVVPFLITVLMIIIKEAINKGVISKDDAYLMMKEVTDTFLESIVKDD